jgi:hypothetical protein
MKALHDAFFIFHFSFRVRWLSLHAERHLPLDGHGLTGA